MKEPQRILELFEDLYNGDPWLDVTLIGTLQHITADQAAQKKYPDRNSIWEITNHIISWRLNVLQRVQGIVTDTPEDNYFLPVADTSSEAWEKTIDRLKESEDKWREFLENLPPKNLDDGYLHDGHTNYEHVHGIIQHDAYHLGQIVLLCNHPE